MVPLDEDSSNSIIVDILFYYKTDKAVFQSKKGYDTFALVAFEEI